jgi:hypothetical protein
MKNVVLLMIIVFGIVGCGKSDDPQQELIVGTWGKSTSIGTDGVFSTLDHTNVNNQIILKADGTFVFLEANGLSGTWVNLGKGNYKLENKSTVIPFSATYKVEFTSAIQMKWTLVNTPTLIWTKLN